MSGDYVPNGEITVAMNIAGGQTVVDCLADQDFMAKPNMAGELAARVYKAMASARVLSGELFRTSNR